MKRRRLGKRWRLGLSSVEILGLIALWGSSAVAQTPPVNQIQPDNTLGNESSEVNPDTIRGQLSDRIEGGAERGSNLFHSFQEFNVSEGQGAYFSNPEGIANILTRVTGGNRSEILGTLGVLGEANLFLINPNGILFGPNSSLDVEGSFVGTTAESLIFDDSSEFSAINPPSSLLTITAPVGLQIGSDASAIINQSQSSIGEISVGLFVEPGKNLTLVGGEINLDGGRLTALGGRVELGGLSAQGKINLNNDASLNLPDNVARADIFLSKGALVEVGAFNTQGGGDIIINARNLRLSRSGLTAGIVEEDLETPNLRAGDIEIHATDTVFFSNGSFVNNLISGNDSGDTGDINITTGSLVVNQSILAVSHRGQQGNSGNVKIEASNLVSFNGENSGISSAATQEITGNGGSININSASVSLTNGTQLNSSTFTDGDGGNISILTDSFSLTNDTVIRSATFGEGNAGEIRITARDNFININSASVSLTNGAELDSSTFAEGDGGNISILTGSFSLTNGAVIRSATFGEGNAGEIRIAARDNFFVDQEGLITNAVASEGIGNAKGIGNANNIVISTRILSLANSAIISSSTFGKGNAGNILIKASESISINQTSELQSLTSGLGNAGNIIIETDEDGTISFDEGLAISRVNDTGVGKGGNISITTSSLFLTNGAQLNTNTLGEGNAGNVKITAVDTVSFDGEDKNGSASGVFSEVFESAIGNGGKIEISTTNLLLSNGAALSSSTAGQESGGTIQVYSDFLSLRNNAQLNSFSLAKGNAGNITIDILGVLEADSSEIDTSSTQSTGGNIKITASGIRLRSDSDIRTNVASSVGDGGDIELTADSILAFDDSDILAFAQDGRGGNITLNTPAYFGSNFQGASLDADPESLDGNDRADINATGAVSGVVTLPNVSFIQNSLFELPENAIDTEGLIANSCVARSTDSESTFIITGGGGLPVRPGDAAVSPYATGTVQTIPNEAPTSSPEENNWEKGDPIVEPQGVYRLPNGELVMSRECS